MTQKPMKLLLVEDSVSDADLIQSALEEAAVAAQVLHVKDGGQAVDFLFSRTDRYKERELPDWILLDLKLPKLNGLEVLRLIRSHPETAKLPVVVFTSSAEECDLVESYRLNANSYIQKPVDFEEFNRSVKELGTYWARMNRYPGTWTRVASAR